MRIAIVNDDHLVDADWQQLCSALAAHGHQVTAYLRRRDQHSPEVLTGGDLRIVSVCAGPAEPTPTAAVLPFVGDWAAELVRLWSAEPPDIVHAYGWLGGLAAQLAARRQRLPTVQTFHGLASMERQQAANTERSRLEPLLIRDATWVTGGSSDEVDELARVRHSRSHLSILSTGVDVARFAPVGPALARTELHRVLCLEPNPLSDNGLDKTIRVLPKLSGTELMLAETGGSDPRYDEARDELRQLAAGLGVGDRVNFMGSVDADALPPLLRSADVVACTPRLAPRATTALQAMASAVAVVAESVGAMTDIVVNSVTGLLVAPNRPDELVNALKTLQEQSFRRQGMGATGRLRAESRYSWDRIALDALHIYEQMGSLQQAVQVANAG